MGNDVLTRAKQARNDEFYTYYQDIKDELQHYTDFFRDQRVYCPCDSRESNFWKYLCDNYEALKLKSLGRSSINDTYEIYGQKETMQLENGNFFSQEVQDILSNYDLIVTNPPFSVVKQFVSMLEELHLKYILVANENVFISAKIFPLIKKNKIRIGYTRIKEFNTPEGPRKFGNIIWITNLPIIKENQPLPLTAHYDPDLYPEYENYAAINVDRVTAIPCDYDGVMGVPVTYLNKHCPSQFEIVGYAGSITKKNGLNYDVPYWPHSEDRGGDGMVNGVRKYARVLIKRKK